MRTYDFYIFQLKHTAIKLIIVLLHICVWTLYDIKLVRIAMLFLFYFKAMAEACASLSTRSNEW